ncbi:hypothetical protein LRP50_14940 [Enterovibrio sp. ZSDZ42]|uniref:Uncharacterized protein n=1 Tax=Enterovibrio gelatinilyticus TaxID=2899819 RepID=A0ABT5R2C7_9GAMM|nr:hypothetical protein [Enterovibrio sp. ZSDZ42]MDD1794428.1 hypothetical protein [Enterovibrio sp. ZSDZ42]
MKLPHDWFHADSEDKEMYGKELNLEMLSGHFLFSKNIEVYAHRNDATDDILCRHIDAEDLYTVVHLTWSMRPEIDNKHPTVEFHGSYDEFLQYNSKFFN